MQIRDYHRKAKESGSIVSALMSVLILGITVSFAARSISSAMKANRAIELENGKQLIKRTIVKELSCSSSNFSSCTGNACTDLNGASGSVIAASDGSTKLGAWNIRSCCRNNRIKLIGALGQNEFSKHPINNKVMDWNQVSGEIIDLTTMCSGANNSNSSSGPVSIQYGAMCNVGQGRCAHPKGYVSNFRGCCTDGSDGVKPQCPSGKELVSYWDRASEWGMYGRWVVLCQ